MIVAIKRSAHRGLAPPAGIADLGCLPVVTHHPWMVNRDVVRLALEVVCGVTALGHHRPDQTVRRGAGRSRGSDELYMRRLPRLVQLRPCPRIPPPYRKMEDPEVA